MLADICQSERDSLVRGERELTLPGTMVVWLLTQEISNTMRHTREEVIERTIREFERLDRVVAGLADEVWNQPLRRPTGKDPWTVKDALVHITHWKANTAPKW